MSVKDSIIKIVNDYPGIKATELVVKVVEELYCGSKGTRVLFLPLQASIYERAAMLESVPGVLESLVKSGDLVEAEYVVPSMSYRVKSMYFPKDTGVHVRDVSFPPEDQEIVWHHQFDTLEFEPSNRTDRDFLLVPKKVILHSDGRVSAYGPGKDLYHTIDDFMLCTRISPNILLGKMRSGPDPDKQLRALTKEFLSRCAPPKGYVPEAENCIIEYGWKAPDLEGYRACVWVNDFVRFGSENFTTTDQAIGRAKEMARDVAENLTSYTMKARD